MAVFFNNDCTYGCGKTFPTKSYLIHHIESTHLDFDIEMEEYESEIQADSCVPLSYILRYSSFECPDLSSVANPLEPSTNDTDRCVDVKSDLIYDSNNNDNFWVTTLSENLKPKQYKCSYPGCNKAYKNPNGIRYHWKNGHRRIAKQTKHPKRKKQSSDKPIRTIVTQSTSPSSLYCLSSCYVNQTTKMQAPTESEKVIQTYKNGLVSISYAVGQNYPQTQNFCD
ncbi:juxtaposed with another zinc finger protein 1-like isoform X2 [Photinus pyralis]|uniref:juxtaposed with another zinc finger protein 1-like isoform X2 n=1 Tax=Photinus pyralis TaxID=7054 RepID=UPI0012672ACF|nr:juxtaposed with another zinc finger protein 1-like isoform X2 [Photinus pyralis]